MGWFVAAPGRVGAALLLLAVAACAGRSIGPPSASQGMASDPKLEGVLEDVRRTSGSEAVGYAMGWAVGVLAFLIATKAGDVRAQQALQGTSDALVARYASAQGVAVNGK